MTANPDSALRQALVAAEKAILPLNNIMVRDDRKDEDVIAVSTIWRNPLLTAGEVRRAREAHALIIEALQRGEKAAE